MQRLDPQSARLAGSAKPPDLRSSGGGPTIGLTLGGGGARGFAHIHVIEAMAEMGLRPVAISGASIGAVVGAGFATGIEATEVAEYARRLVGTHRHALKLMMSKRSIGLLDVFDFRRGGGAILKSQSVLGLALPELMQHSFETLVIPTKVVATDFYGRRQEVFAQGPLEPALAASIALPSLFAPVAIDGRYYVDGGLTNPLPYDLIREAADIVVAVDVTGGAGREPAKMPTSAEVLFGSLQIMLHALVDEKLKAKPPDVLIVPPIEHFRLLDFFKLDQVLEESRPVRETVKRELDAAITLFETRKNAS